MFHCLIIEVDDMMERVFRMVDLGESLKTKMTISLRCAEPYWSTAVRRVVTHKYSLN